MQIRERMDASLGGKSLRHLDSRIVIRNIQDSAEENALFADNPVAGKRLLSARRDSLQVTLTFTVWEFQRLADRMQAIQAANAWAAAGGFLTVSTRPGQRLRVRCTGYAQAQDLRNYQEEMSLTFTAAGTPFWEEEKERAITLTGASASGSMLCGGTVSGDNAARAEFAVKATGGTLNTLTVTVGDTSMSFSSLGIAQGNTLTLAYDNRGFQRIYQGSNSKLSRRSAASKDDLLAPPGSVAFAVSANVAVSARFKVRGRFR